MPLRYGDIGPSGGSLWWGDLDTVENYFVLSVQDSKHDHGVDSNDLTQTEYLTIGDTAHWQGVDSSNLTQSNVVVLGDTTHGHLVDGDFVLPAHPISVANAQQRVRTLPFGLFQGNPILVDYAYHEHLPNSIIVIPGTTSNYRIVAEWQDTTIYGPEDNPYYEFMYRIDSDDNYIYTLSYLTDTTAAFNINLRSDQLLEIAVRTVNDGLVTLWTNWQPVELLISEFLISPQDAKHDHAVDGTLGLSIAVSLNINDALHSFTSYNLNLSLWWSLFTRDATQGQSATNIGLVQANNILPNDTSHNQLVEVPELSLLSTLSLVRDSRHGHAVDNLGISQANILDLTFSEASHFQTVENPVLLQHQILTLSDALHSHLVEGGIVLIQANLLAPTDTTHAHIAENSQLTTFGIFPASTNLVHSVDEVVIIQANIINVRETMQAHGVDAVFLATSFILIVAGADHSHSIDALVITQDNLLAILDTLIVQGIDQIQLSIGTEFTLIVSPALHAHLAGAAVEFPLPPGSRVFLISAEDRVFMILQ